MGVCPCGDAHFTESVYDQKTAKASLRLKTKVWNQKRDNQPRKRTNSRPRSSRGLRAVARPLSRWPNKTHIRNHRPPYRSWLHFERQTVLISFLEESLLVLPQVPSGRLASLML